MESSSSFSAFAADIKLSNKGGRIQILHFRAPAASQPGVTRERQRPPLPSRPRAMQGPLPVSVRPRALKSESDASVPASSALRGRFSAGGCASPLLTLFDLRTRYSTCLPSAVDKRPPQACAICSRVFSARTAGAQQFSCHNHVESPPYLCGAFASVCASGVPGLRCSSSSLTMW